jgi:hypothetical protein
LPFRRYSAESLARRRRPLVNVISDIDARAVREDTAAEKAEHDRTCEWCRSEG